MTTKTKLLLGAAGSAVIALSGFATAEAKPVRHHVAHRKAVRHAAAASAGLAEEVRALRDQVQMLQTRLDQQGAAQQQTQAQLQAVPAQAVAQAQAQTQAIQAQDQAKIDELQTQVGDMQQAQAEQTASIAANKPKTDKLYYKGVSITLGGFLAAEGIYRDHDIAADIASNFNAIPYKNNSVGHTQELRGTARQSRISALVQGDAAPDIHLAGYGEIDFQGAAQTANSNQTNSYNPRIRHMYATIDWDNFTDVGSGLHLLAGQNWSLATLNSKGITPRNEVTPPQIDAQYIPGFVFTRQPQLRAAMNWGPEWWGAVSLENPQTTFYTGANALPASTHLVYNVTGGSGFNSANTLSLNHIPDVIAKVAFEPTMGERTAHLEAFGLFRAYYDRYNVTPTGTVINYQNENTYGGGFGFGAIFPLVPKVLDLQASGLFGKGIGRYGASSLPDVTFTPQGHVKPIGETMLLAGGTWHANPLLDSYAFGGQERDDEAATALVGGAVVPYGYGNPLYDNRACFSETPASGTACIGNTKSVTQGTIGFWQKIYQGPFGRAQFGIQYSYTERKAFEGMGGAPKADENMIFTSFRYYPF
jgi:hypothetical protein